MFNAGFNPYSVAAKEGLFSALKTKINWGAILTNTQKTLNIVNQAIPLVYQVKPIVNNARTVFKIMGAVRDDNNDNNITNNNVGNNSSYRTNQNNTRVTPNTISNLNTNNTINNNNQPVFFL